MAERKINKDVPIINPLTTRQLFPFRATSSFRPTIACLLLHKLLAFLDARLRK